MSLIQLPVNWLPLEAVYARTIDDIFRWYEEFIEGEDIFPEIMSNKELDMQIDLKKIRVIERARLEFDLPGGNSFYSKENPMPEISITEELTIRISDRLIAHFELYQQMMGDSPVKVSGLYRIERYPSILPFLSYVPKYIFDAVRTCDITALKESRREVGEEINRKLFSWRLVYGAESRFYKSKN